MTNAAFELVRHATIDSLDIDVQEYLHSRTGARHFHFAADDDNNAFLVAFLTVPQDSTGVAHILEHTSLCGSQRFPVRDPFFMMVRRSLNTFMNAFTSSDWTAYPFATRNRKDFYNLLQVYLDAVFFPSLDALDFAQEGHRVEFETADDPQSPLVYKGIVYNEMKGAMSSPVSQLWQTLQSQLFPTVTYHFNSGGDPEVIPDLTHADLKAFHATHYHPSNALFMTYGDLPVDEHQTFIEDSALSRFTSRQRALGVPDERRFDAPQSAEATYAVDNEEQVRDKTHIVMAWLLGRNCSIEELMRAHLLGGLLLDNSSSPLRHALETSELGVAPSELCGLDDSTREMSFMCGLEGSNPEQSSAVQALVLGVLEDVAREGVAAEQVESMLHQLELNQREIKGGSFPYGLRVMVNTLGATLHGGDPISMLDIDPVLASLREQAQDPDFVQSLVRSLLLDNPHRICLTMSPDPRLEERRQAQETQRLQALRAAMGEEECQALMDLAARLQRRQESEDDPEILPKVGLEDVPPTLHVPEPELTKVAGWPCSWYSQGTNGLVYEQLVIELPRLSDDLLDTLPLFTECLTEVGSAGRDYVETQARQAAVSGGISARCSLSSQVDDVQQNRGFFVLAGKALARNHQALTELLIETLDSARFDELRKIRELISETRVQRETAVTGHGHALALAAACATMCPIAAITHRWDGLLGLKTLKALDEALNDEGELTALAERYGQILDQVRSGPRQYALVGEAARRDEVLQSADRAWGAAGASRAGEFSPFTLPSAQGVVREAWLTSTQVNFCAKAYPAVPQHHPDAATLTVLSVFLRNGYLHRTVREQGGAYGGGASYDPESGAFRFFSYRDPRLTETLADFDRSVEWLQEHAHPARTLEEAILGVVSSIDRPGSPAGEAIKAYFSHLHGRTAEWRREFRRRVLAVTLDDLRAVGARYLHSDAASIAVVSHAGAQDALTDLGLQIHQL